MTSPKPLNVPGEGVSPLRASLRPPAGRGELRAVGRRVQRSSVSPAIPRRTDPGATPLSFSQQRMWFLDQWEPGAPTFNGARAIRIRGKLNVDALKTAFAAVVERHESLRTIFVLHGREPRQVVLDQWSLELPVVDLTAVPLRDRARSLRIAFVSCHASRST